MTVHRSGCHVPSRFTQRSRRIGQFASPIKDQQDIQGNRAFARFLELQQQVRSSSLLVRGVRRDDAQSADGVSGPALHG